MPRDFIANRVIVDWLILTFDKTSAEPFPLSRKWHVLDLSTLEQHLAEEIYAAVRRGEPREQALNLLPQGNDWIVTIDSAPKEPDFSFLRYRRYFRPSTPDEIQRMHDAPGADTIRTTSPSLMGEYFEDESGKPITHQEMFEHLQPGFKALVRYDVSSVLSIGPVRARHEDAWNTQAANTISHYLYVIEKIASSRWFRSPLALTFTQSQSGSNVILDFVSADRESTFEILALVRQLYSSDDLFNKAANIYMRHVSDDGKRWWLKEVKTAFNESLSSHSHMPSIPGCSRRMLIDTLLYGAGIIHAPGATSSQADLMRLIAEHGKEKLMMTILSSMRDLVSWPSLAYHPIRQDFGYWTSACGMVHPDRPNVDSLFQTRQRTENSHP